MEFSRFCACGPEDRAELKRQVDGCAQLGRSYEFPNCRLPPGCRPAQASIGFWRAGEDYLLYFRPVPSYTGQDPRLRAFFDLGPVQRFPSFQAMTDRLQALSEGRPAPPQEVGGTDLFQRLLLELGTRVLGQEQAVEAAAFKLWTHTCKRDPQRPLSLIFHGPTGVGKSELGKAIAPALNRCLGEERYRLVWTELNTFTQAHSVYRLTGAPPGYVGYDDAPVLEAVRRYPHTVFMFDELDKAHPEVLKVFMSILDEGRCTARREGDGGERELDFRRCILLFTTNTDLSHPQKHTLGFSLPSEEIRAPAAALDVPCSSPSGLARRLFQADEGARLALTRSGVLREIAGRFSGLIGFRDLDGEARAGVTVRQIAALGREYGLNITQVAPAIAQALTPPEALSLRSGVPVLEGAITPLLLANATLAGCGTALQLAGTLEDMRLLPA